MCWWQCLLTESQLLHVSVAVDRVPAVHVLVSVDRVPDVSCVVSPTSGVVITRPAKVVPLRCPDASLASTALGDLLLSPAKSSTAIRESSPRWYYSKFSKYIRHCRQWYCRHQCRRHHFPGCTSWTGAGDAGFKLDCYQSGRKPTIKPLTLQLSGASSALGIGTPKPINVQTPDKFLCHLDAGMEICFWLLPRPT